MEYTLNTLDTIAAKLSLYRAENIPAEYLEVQQHPRGGTIESAWKLTDAYRRGRDIPEELKKYPAGKYWICSESLDIHGRREYLYIEDHPRDLILTPAGNLAIIRAEHKGGKIYFYPNYHHAAGVYQDYKYRPQPEPNKIGVFTDKKIQAWLNHVDQWVENLSKERDRLTDKAGEYRAIVEALKDLPGKSDYYKNETRFFTNFWYLKIKYHADSGYIERTAEYRGNFEQAVNFARQEVQP